MNAKVPEAAGMGTIDAVRSLVQQLLGDGTEVAATARLEADLQLESLDLLTLADLLRERYGPRVDLSAHIATLDFDDLLGITVLDVATYVAGRIAA